MGTHCWAFEKNRGPAAKFLRVGDGGGGKRRGLAAWRN